MTSRKAKTIFRTASRSNPYAQLRREMLQDSKIKPDAKGILCFIMSLPEDWAFDLVWLTKNQNIGRDKALRVVQELIDLGYCKRVRDRNERGHLGSVEYLFSDDPKWVSPQPENPVVVTQDIVAPQPGLPILAEPILVQPILAQPTLAEPTLENPTCIDKYTKDKSNRFTNADAPLRGASNDEFDFGSNEGKAILPPASDTGSAKKRPPQIPAALKIEKGSSTMYRPDAETLEAARKLARGWDVTELVAEFNAMNEGNTLHHPDKAFIGWCERKGSHPDVYRWKPTGKPPPADLLPKAGEVAIVKLSAEWDRWLEHVHKLDRPAADRMRAAFVVFAPSKNPTPGSSIPRIPAPTPKGKAA
jgi:hypothetical protein